MSMGLSPFKGTDLILNSYIVSDKKLPTVTKLPSRCKEQQKETEKYLLSLHGCKIRPGLGEAF